MSKSGQRAPAITYGNSKDHRPDLKQLLFIPTAGADGGCRSNTTGQFSTGANMGNRIKLMNRFYSAQVGCGSHNK
jgi:hypothetical protein